MLVRWCQWLEHSFWINSISDSIALSVLVELAHYFGFFLVVGSIGIVNLRILGIAGRREHVAQLSKPLFPVMWAGLTLVILSGFLMFAGQATMFFPNSVFRIKMLVVLSAIVVGAIVQVCARSSETSQPPSIGIKVLAVVSLLLWIGAILAAVEIPHLTYVP